MYSKSIIVVAAAALGIAIYAFRAPHVPKVSTVSPVRQPIAAALPLTGKIVNDRVVKLTALADGRLLSTIANKGDHVSAGDLIAVFDKVQAQAEYQKAIAELERAQTSVDVNLAKLKRTEKLNSTAGSSVQSLEEARAEYQYGLAQRKVAEANVELADIKRSHTEITTPYSGTIIEKTSEAGQWMSAGTLLYSLVADEGFEIEALVDASDINQVSIGQEVTATSDADPDQSWQTKIRWIAPSISENDDRNSADVAIRLPIGDGAPMVRLNQQIEISVETARNDEALVVPLAAIIDDEDGGVSVAVVVNDRIEFRRVRTGVENIDFVEIVDGLAANDQVVTSGHQTLRAGHRVAVTKRRSGNDE